MSEKKIHMHVNIGALESSAKQQFDSCCAKGSVEVIKHLKPIINWKG